jgi:hypothetical protein
MVEPSGEYRMKPDLEIHDPALKGAKWVSVLSVDGNDVQLSIREDSKMPRTHTIDTDYFHELFEKVTSDKSHGLGAGGMPIIGRKLQSKDEESTDEIRI